MYLGRDTYGMFARPFLFGGIFLFFDALTYFFTFMLNELNTHNNST